MASNSSSVAANIARRSQPAKATKTIPIVMLAVNDPVVDKILHGANPADLPVAGATQFTFSVNREALKGLRLSLPGDIGARVDEWVE